MFGLRYYSVIAAGTKFLSVYFESDRVRQKRSHIWGADSALPARQYRGQICPDFEEKLDTTLSKHQAADEQPQASDISWIQGLSKPVTAASTENVPFDGDLAVHAPRHSASDEPANGAQVGGPDAAQVGGTRHGGRSKWRRPVLVVAAAALCLLTVGGGTVAATQKNASTTGGQNNINATSNSVAGQAAAGTGHDSSTPGSARSLSANRSRPIPVGGPVVGAAALHTVAVSIAGGPKTSSTTSAKNVGALLVEKKIKLGARDTVTPAVATTLSDGMIVKVNRIVVSIATKTVALKQPAAKSVNDPAIATGTKKVVVQGKAGTELITYRVTKVNGKQTAKVESSRKTVVAPVGTMTHVGTKTTFTYVGNEVFTNDTSFGVNWDGLANCESTHNPKAVNANPSAGLPTYGLFQFDVPTWATVGGSGNPMDASPQEQLMRAKLLYQQRGLEPWACRDAAH